jgi:hypothetical protein
LKSELHAAYAVAADGRAGSFLGNSKIGASAEISGPDTDAAFWSATDLRT